jgi:hypothetical protein
MDRLGTQISQSMHETLRLGSRTRHRYSSAL